MNGPRTKIVATVGPASRGPDRLRRLADAGVSVFRLNFSHGTHDEHSATIAAIDALGRDLGRHLGVLQDLSGPKMRLGSIPGDIVHCALGETFTLVAGRSSDDPHELTCTYANLPNDLKAGESVLFADGTVAMTVTATARDRATMKVTLPGALRSKQGVNLPGSSLSVPSLTDQDLQDLDWTARHAALVHFVGLSFARRGKDVATLKEELRARKCPARVVVKIEKPEAVERLDEIIAEADAVMVARGDLGVEVDVARVPAIQKRVIAACNRAHRPVITATQMLNSMEHSSRPTRAEASDVFNAVLDGSDAVMLSGESAIGDYPVEAVETMRRICAEAEAYSAKRPASAADDAPLAGWIEPVTEAAVDAADLMTARLEAPLIVVATESGRTALALSNRRPAATILALTRDLQLAATLSICWGVTAIVRPAGSSHKDAFVFGIEWARAHGLVAPGQHAVLVRGQTADQPGGRAVLAREVS